MCPPNRDTTWQQGVVTVGLGGKGKPLRGKVVLGATFRMESGGSLMGGMEPCGSSMEQQEGSFGVQ